MIDTKGKFYLGRHYDTASGRVTEEPLLFDPDDLTTHAVVFGMTGSGKTGLCIDLLEEAALRGLPALMIDPKGDITNTLLHFPELQPEQFQPWVNADEARRAGKSVEEAASDAATLWRNGLAEWGITPERIQALQNSTQFTVFTPGSDAGVPVNILASWKAPDLSWDENREALRERIAGMVTGILGLVGMSDVDPVRSREHILLSNIFEHAWSKGQDLDLAELILETKTPPFTKLGVFDINTFFPEKDRFGLAMLLNNIMAAPSFQTWLEGQPLDIPGLLYTPDGRPRHSVFYIAHLSDAERMFFVTLLFAAVETWMRSQSGTSSLRALVYFDEIFGYLPPTQNPASKQAILRMLKQARAFGVGLVLATQNPVDVDYKGLSNTGCWFLGRLQTDQDKQRLLDGLQGAAPGINRAEYDRLLSSLGKRVFLLHNVHAKQPALFQTRWAMNYLAGPLTRTQIPALNRLAGGEAGVPPAQAYSAPQPAMQAVSASPQPIPDAPAQTTTSPGQQTWDDLPGSRTRPTVPARINEFFLPHNLTVSEAIRQAGRSMPAEVKDRFLLYKPVLFGQTSIRFLDRRYNVDSELMRTALVVAPDRRGIVRWENFQVPPLLHDQLDDGPDPQGRFAPLDAPLNDPRLIKEMERDFVDWAYQTSTLKIWSHETLKVYGSPEMQRQDFLEQTAAAARDARDTELERTSATFDRRLDTLRSRLEAAERALDRNQTEHSQRKMEELGTHAETAMSLFSKRKRSLSTSMTKRRMTEKAKAAVEESRKKVEEAKRQLSELEKEKAAALQAVNERWAQVAGEVREITLTPLKKDVRLEYFGIAWMPYHLIRTSEGLVELPGFGKA
jgi:hypothetical protein